MLRVFAYIVDYIFIVFLVYGIRVGCIKTVLVPRLIVFILIFSVMYLYFFLNDLLFRGRSLGKFIAGVQVELKEQSRIKFAILHSTLKMFATIFSIFVLILYFCRKCSMPYDSFFFKKIS